MPSARDIYQATRKHPDQPWNTYVCRPLAAGIVAALAGTRVTPNQVTLAAMAVALVSVALFVVLPGHAGLVVAVAVYELSYVLDCADGMLARHRNVQSVVGHHLDFLMDEIKAFAILAAISARLSGEHADPRYLLLGLVGLVCLASGVALTTFLRLPEVSAPRAAGVEEVLRAPAPRSVLARAVGAAEGVAKFVIHYPSYIWLPAVLGRMELFLYPYIVVNALYAARSLAVVALRFGRSSGL